jgi:hypothetical protein
MKDKRKTALRREAISGFHDSQRGGKGDESIDEIRLVPFADKNENLAAVASGISSHQPFRLPLNKSITNGNASINLYH